MALLTYGPHARLLPAWAQARVVSYLDACGIRSAEITSTWRSPEDQARVMVEQYGTPERAAHLYAGPKGRAILLAWAENLQNPIPAMRDAMTAVEFVSAHMNPNLATIDLAPSSMPGDAIPALVAHVKSRIPFHEVKEVFGPGESDAAVHFALIPPTAGRVWT